MRGVRIAARIRLPGDTCMRCVVALSVVGVVGLAASLAHAVGTDAGLPSGAATKPVIAAPPGTLTALVLESGLGREAGFVLAGRDSQQQLIVTGTYSGGQLRDLTRQVRFEPTPAGI